MADEKGEIREINFRQLLPWTELFQAFRIALDLRKLLLAAAAIVVMSIGWWVLAWVFGPAAEPVPKEDTPEHFLWSYTKGYKEMPWERERKGNPYLVVRDEPHRLLEYGFWSDQAPVLLEPLKDFLRPVKLMIHEQSSFRTATFAFLGLVMMLATWGIFGGAITRIAAVQIAKNEKIGLVESLKFAASKFISFFGAPLFPFVGVAFISLLIILGGLLLFIPVFGDLVASLFWPLALLGGFLMAIILLGLIGWPLMYATISTEGSDSFDALSRSYSYVYQRPWHYLFYAFVSVLYGVLVIFFVVLVTTLFVYLAKLAVGLLPHEHWTRDIDPASALFVYAPTSYNWRDLLVEGDPANLVNQMSRVQLVSAGIVSLWLNVVFLLMLGFAYSYFWSSSTIIYFLLRKKVDDTELDEVYLEEEEEEPYIPPTTPTPPEPAAATTSSTLPLTEPPPPESGAAPPES